MLRKENMLMLMASTMGITMVTMKHMKLIL